MKLENATPKFLLALNNFESKSDFTITPIQRID